jgi:hypothetical protein
MKFETTCDISDNNTTFGQLEAGDCFADPDDHDPAIRIKDDEEGYLYISKKGVAIHYVRHSGAAKSGQEVVRLGRIKTIITTEG